MAGTRDSLAGIGAYEGLQGCWLIELGELAAMRKIEIETIKNFISKQVDSYRAAYGRRVEDHPCQCVFIGTTSSTAFLRDDTGNRRFRPVRLLDQTPAKTVWGHMSMAKRQGWFAEDDTMRAVGTQRRAHVSAKEVWAECFGNDPHRFPRQDRGKVNVILRHG